MPTLTGIDRIDEKIQINKETGCWNWTASKHPSGYGKVYFQAKLRYAHRVTYTLIKGEIPDGLVIDHLCRNRSCVNPSHLEPVTSRENALRGETFTARQFAKTHCVRGHEFTDENTYRHNGHRNCRKCMALHAAATNAKRARCPKCGNEMVARYVPIHLATMH